MADGILAASFRDPSGFVFRYRGDIYRQINEAALDDLEHLETSGLYGELVTAGLLIPHEDAEVPSPEPSPGCRIIHPTQVPFVSYPYEWCFGQLKDAALTTLEIQLAGLRYEMSLKDASAFNIQFLDGRPVLIDTLSFERYEAGNPWVAYAQFCEHFLGPLLLMSSVDPMLGRLSALSADGIPLQVVSRLLPWRSRLRLSTLLHIHLHARSISGFGGRRVPKALEARGLSRRAMQNLVEGLKGFVEGLEWNAQGTEWGDYETEHGYSDLSRKAKHRTVGELLEIIQPNTVWDLGANTGEYSRLALARGAQVIAIDSDPAAVEHNYRRMRRSGERSLHPLWVDILAPSPDLGWAESERDGLSSRSKADAVLALAILHHLAISGNVPFQRILQWLARLAPHAVIEFIPKDDPQAQRLLLSREDVFTGYTQDHFEDLMAELYEIQSVRRLPGSQRVIFHGVRRDP